MMASILLMMFGFIAFYIRFFAWHNGGMVHIQGWTDQFSGFSGNIIVLPIWYVPYWLSTSTFFYPRCLELGKNILEDNWLKILLSICVLPFQIASWILNFQDGSLRLFLSYSANFDWKKSAPKPAGSGYHWTLQEVILRGSHPIHETVVWSQAGRWLGDRKVWRKWPCCSGRWRKRSGFFYPGFVCVNSIAHWMTSQWKWWSWFIEFMVRKKQGIIQNLRTFGGQEWQLYMKYAQICRTTRWPCSDGFTFQTCSDASAHRLASLWVTVTTFRKTDGLCRDVNKYKPTMFGNLWHWNHHHLYFWVFVPGLTHRLWVQNGSISRQSGRFSSSEVSSERDISLALDFWNVFIMRFWRLIPWWKKWDMWSFLMGFSSFSQKKGWFLLKEWEKPWFHHWFTIGFRNEHGELARAMTMPRFRCKW